MHIARKKKRGIFYSRPRHRKLAEIVTFASVSAARSAARKLVKMFREAKRRDTKRVIKSATVLAANRAMAAAKRRDLSAHEKQKLREISVIYHRAASRMVLPPKRR